MGDPAVGKTTLRKRYMGEGFGEEYMSTLGVEFASKEVEFEGQPCLLQIWDLAGQAGYSGMHDSYFRGTMGILLIFDLTNMKSFNNLSNWISKFQHVNKGNMVPIVVVGNKSDLVDSENPLITKRKITQGLAQIKLPFVKVFKKPTMIYHEASAKLNVAVDDAFKDLIGMMIA